MPARLKSLELHGYKTFAALTTFEFASRVTAIVGPNGSGKSNIADSLRWVLGEQSYSLLRGKKTEDMIFSGSEGRPRASMASATIVFDNSDGWLPIDFSEVAITRRAYRDGENEYLLNGQRVRLKDVSELLAQSGLAERTYTIIGQGLVDAALALKAEERRRLFEEAAGIGLHRSRREEALRRLDATQHNLERVLDILAELQPRLRSLERQARRAQEYEQITADLRVLLREWYGYHWHNAQKELSEARDAARLQERDLDKARGEQVALDQALNQARASIQDLRNQLSGWHRQLANLHTRRESTSRDLAVADERLRALSDGRKRMQGEMARLEEELGILQEQVGSSNAEAFQVKAELDDARQQIDEARKALTARQAERTQAEAKVQSARQALSSLTGRQNQLQARLSERQEQAKRQADALQDAIQALEGAEKETQQAEKRLQAAVEAQKEATAKRQAADEALQSLRQRQGSLENARKEALDTRSAQNAEVTRLRAQLEVLDQAEKALTGYGGGARLLIQAARQGKLSGARGALSSFLETPAEMETAIAAVLGEFLDGMLFEPGVNPEQALAILEGQASRAALLPMDIRGDQDQIPDLPAAAQAECLGQAARLVKTAPELRPLINWLLGQVWVVPDRAAAGRFLAVLAAGGGAWLAPGLGGRLVTLRGEVFHFSGPVIAGQEGKPPTLSRPRQRRELQDGLAEAEKRLAEQDTRVRQVEQEIAGLRQEIERQAQEAQSQRKGEEAARSEHSQMDLAAEKARRQQNWQREQRQRLEAELQRGAADMRQLSADLSRLEQEIGQARKELRAQDAALAALSLGELQEQLAHWNTCAAVAERALTEANNRQKERLAALEKARQTKEGLQRQSEEAQEGMLALDQGKATLREVETAVSREIEALQVQIEPAEAYLDTAEREQAGLQAREADARQGLNLAEHRHAQARINLARRQEALDSLQRRIEDDFGLVAYEYTEEVSGPTPLPLNGMVELLPMVTELNQEMEENIKNQRALLRRMGPINPEARAEYIEVKQRFDFLNEQVADLKKAEADVKEVIAELDLLMQREFRKTFDAVAHEFREIFARLFGGGSAHLVLTDPENLTETGIDIDARLPGRRTQGLSLLSGGERSLTAAALVFALLKVSPTPFCVLDEVDAMLDEANVGRFRELLSELSQNTQFVVVTHNRNTVQAADVIYGITMGRDSASQVLSLKLDQVDQVVKDDQSGILKT